MRKYWRYSVFDWGEMPDEIKNKGRALAVMAAFNFEELHRRGIKTHYRGLVTSDGHITAFSELVPGRNGLDTMQVDLAVVYPPIARQFIDQNGNSQVEYDYSFFQENVGGINNFLVPLEIIFRNGLPLGSSVFKKIKAAKALTNLLERELTLKEIYHKLGLTSEPAPGDMLPKPVISYTTKLEAGDRNLDDHEARIISGLLDSEFDEIVPLALRVNEFITEQAERTGISPHWDGKVEMRLIDGGLQIVDVVGTPDEDRFGRLVSKEFIRQWYIQNQPDFVAACEEWKQTGEGWQERCPVKPKNLPPELATLVSQMYMATCNNYTQREIFITPDLEKVMEDLQQFV